MTRRGTTFVSDHLVQSRRTSRTPLKTWSHTRASGAGATNPEGQMSRLVSNWRTCSFAAAALLLAASAAVAQSGPLVRTEQGWVQGLAVGNVEQFRGVPYATPPLGNLRWRAPLPPAFHAAVLQATAFPAP